MSFREIYKKGLDSVRLSRGKSAWGLEIGDRVTDSGVKTGLFATKKENIYSLLPSLAPIRVNLDAIQITPIAIYNLVHLSSDSDEDVIVVNVEQGNTDFIVVGRSKYWNRSIPISEVNTTLIREIQRSIGYYVSVTKGTKPETLYLMGLFISPQSLSIVAIIN